MLLAWNVSILALGTVLGFDVGINYHEEDKSIAKPTVGKGEKKDKQKKKKKKKKKPYDGTFQKIKGFLIGPSVFYLCL